MKKVLTVSSIFLLIYLSLDVIFRPNFTLEQFGLSSELLLVFFVFFSSILYLVNRFSISSKLIKINQKVIFPLFGVVSLLLVARHHYSWHLNIPYYEKFLNLTLLTGFLIYINQSFKTKTQQFLYAIAPIFLSITLVVYHLNSDFLRVLIREDGVYEYGQAILFLLCFIVSFQINKLYKKKNRKQGLLFLLLSLGFLFVAFEEISWGQRLLEINTPEIMLELNTQDEISIHNLVPIQKNLHFIFIAVGFYGSFLPIILKKYARHLHQKFSLFFPEKHLYFYFFSVLGFYFLYDFFIVYFHYIFGEVSQFHIWRWQEVAESFLASGFFLYILDTRKKIQAKTKK